MALGKSHKQPAQRQRSVFRCLPSANDHQKSNARAGGSLRPLGTPNEESILTHVAIKGVSTSHTANNLVVYEDTHGTQSGREQEHEQ